MSENINGEDLVSKTGTKSKAWDYFGSQKGKDGKPLDMGVLFVELTWVCYL